MKLCLLLVAILACGTAQAVDWTQIGSDKTTNVYADLSHIKVDVGVRETWFKTVYSPHTQLDNDGKRFVRETIGRFKFRCSEETVSINAATTYFEDGTNLGGNGDDYFVPVTPDTILELQMKWICNLKL